MAYTVTKNADGDLSIGNLRGELVTLQPAISDYATNGYLVEGIPPSAGNVGMDKVIFAISVGDASDYVLKFNPVTSKVKVLQQNGTTGQLVEVGANTDLSAFAFQLLCVGL